MIDSEEADVIEVAVGGRIFLVRWPLQSWEQVDLSTGALSEELNSNNYFCLWCISREVLRSLTGATSHSNTTKPSRSRE